MFKKKCCTKSKASALKLAQNSSSKTDTRLVNIKSSCHLNLKSKNMNQEYFKTKEKNKRKILKCFSDKNLNLKKHPKKNSKTSPNQCLLPLAKLVKSNNCIL